MGAAASVLAVPPVPAGLAGDVIDGQVELSWDVDSSGETSGYNVYANNRYLSTVFDAAYSGTVDEDVLYSFTVVAFGGEPVAFSSSSEPLELPESLIPSDLTIPPSIPGDLAGVIDEDQVTLSWSASTDDETVQGYNLYQNEQYLTTVLDTTYTGPVVPGDSYSWYVVAFDIRNNFSQRSDRLRLPDTGPVDTTIPPTVPTALSGTTAPSDTTGKLSASLTWTASTDDQQVAGYNVYIDGNYTTTVFDTLYTTTIPDIGFTTFSIVAFDFDDNFSSRSESLILPELTDPDALTEPPTQPGDLIGSIVDTTVELSWSPSIDNIGVGGYNVYQNNSYLTTVFDPLYSGTVTADTAYTYYVVAFDRNGNFSTSSEQILLPEGVSDPSAEPPSAPTGLVGTLEEDEEGFFSVSLAWNPADDDGGIAGYNVYRNNDYLTSVIGTSYEGPVPDAGPYSFYVVAFDNPRNFSDASERLSLPTSENQPPSFVGFEDQTIEAGQEWRFVVRPLDIDGGTPGLLGGRLPAGMQSDDNFDGTRTLSWLPLQPDVGEYSITFTAFDGIDPELSTTRTITLTVVMPDDPSTIPNLVPVIDQIPQYRVRSGDAVVMRVKASDRNGTIPDLEMLNLPVGATFDIFPVEDPVLVRVLRWTPTDSDMGTVTFDFLATDAEDTTLTTAVSVDIDVVDPSYFERPGTRLRELAEARDFLLGYAHLLEWYLQPDGALYAGIAAEEFNMMSTENSMKMGYLYPEPDEFRWEGADAEMAFARENNMVVHGHPLIWYSFLPQWIQESDIDDREAIMNTFIDTVVTRYQDDVAIWDVVNEVFEDDGSFRQSVWFEAMGEAYIDQAFIRARANAPDATLLYNDYDVSFDGPKSEAMYTLLQRMLADDVPVDGVGFQMHLTSSFDRFDEVASNFQRFADLGLDVYITELDVAMEPGDTEDQQAAVFSDALALCLAQPACKAAQIWGFTDRYSWLKDETPLILDDDYQPKPAYLSLQNTLTQ